MRTIGLNSFNIFDEPKYILVADDTFTFETIMAINRTIRYAVSTYPTAPWGYVEQALREAGYSVAMSPIGDVFWNPRHWNEHTIPGARSFFVTFPEDAPYEVSNEIFVATTYPGLYAVVPNEYFGGQKLLLLNANNEPVFPDDAVWSKEDSTDQLPLGAVSILRDQFSDESELEEARNALRESGYEVLCETA